MIVFWLPIKFLNASEFAACVTIVSDAASTASGSGGACTGGISGAYICGEFAGGVTIDSVTASRASGSGGTFTGGISVAFIY